MPPQSSRGGPRQRLLPTPRGVNMIVWSLDNRFVLAAIMDRRICVWNAVDGGLVHSLTGHSESSYVLDVHPFNPRIAMSAGYDGRTIVWDIWEGLPIRVYEIGRFKLVDGKFSPDGTSIVLSDDVGQLYTLSTGQGEPQKDAKYDQFFLGDYRPLIQDTHGNVLDQETQLVPYRRNIQDLLCDSSMIPYPEPYQSMYQKRRLGALGIEYNLLSSKLAVGPSDISGFPEYQILPLVDLDRMIEPMPVYIESMDWEPEAEIQSDDSDSEYNVADEFPSEREHGVISNGSSDDSECSAEETDFEYNENRGLNRSKRKKHMADDEFKTASARRIKKRNLNECDGTLSFSNRIKKAKYKKAKVRRSSKSKLLRPQRVAARNALYTLSQCSGESTDEYEDGSETESLDTESSVPWSKEQSDSDSNLPQKHQKAKQQFLHKHDNVPNTLDIPGYQLNDGSRRKIILKLPIRDSNKCVGNIGTQAGKHGSLNSSSEALLEATVFNRKHLGSHDPESSSGAMIAVPSQEFDGTKTNEMEQLREQYEDVENIISAGCKDNKIKWGEVKARTSKRLILGDSSTNNACRNSSGGLVDHNEVGCNLIVNPKATSKNDTQYLSYGVSTSEDMDASRNSSYANESTLSEQATEDGHKQRGGSSHVTLNGIFTKGHKEEPGRSDFLDHEQLLEVDDVVLDNKKTSVYNYKNNTKEMKPIVTKLRIKSKHIGKGACSMDAENWKSLECMVKSQFPSSNCNLISEVPNEDEGVSKNNADDGNLYGFEKLEVGINRSSKLSSLQDSNSKIYNIDKRSKPSKARSDLAGDGSDHNSYSKMALPEASIEGVRRTRSMGMKQEKLEQSMGNKNFKVKFSLNSHEQLLCKEQRSNAGPTVRIRSSRNRRVNYCDNDITLDMKERHKLMKKLSWLLLSENEESLRYIPQKGDNVVYLRQGHQQYVEYHHPSKVNLLWGTLKGKPRSVEFCKVIALVYSTVPGSGESCCKITLKFLDPLSSLVGQTLKFTLPELNDIADFLVERTLYDASIKRNWTTRDKCQVWWKNPHGEGGTWWEGRVVAVRPKSTEFQDSPWERYVIRYKNDSADEIEHSPWELHDPGSPWEFPSIGEHNRTTLLHFIAKLEQSGNRDRDRYGIQKLKQISLKQDFLNRFPVPLSFDVIYSRLTNNYYRNLESVEHDFKEMGSIAQLYLDGNQEFMKKMNRLLESLKETMSTML
ncbi:Bromodomain and wd repeat-containing protein [Thalictrum thalictroides]|uniref:Bromodomain and wd repeat-containing protein n=1 Tax=Thalictrum thalictroides TaxID=46969 RepID=A0A7J6WMH8_THATH|nr:Bromodomain and wd repeat-containing protein [Thalictrum thalictroides]